MQSRVLVDINHPRSSLTAAFFDLRGHPQQIHWRGLFQNIVQRIQTHLQHLRILLLQEITTWKRSVITARTDSSAAAPTREDG